jgi:hypothetical protein
VAGLVFLVVPIDRKRPAPPRSRRPVDGIRAGRNGNRLDDGNRPASSDGNQWVRGPPSWLPGGRTAVTATSAPPRPINPIHERRPRRTPNNSTRPPNLKTSTKCSRPLVSGPSPADQRARTNLIGGQHPARLASMHGDQFHPVGLEHASEFVCLRTRRRLVHRNQLARLEVSRHLTPPSVSRKSALDPKSRDQRTHQPALIPATTRTDGHSTARGHTARQA